MRAQKERWGGRQGSERWRELVASIYHRCFDATSNSGWAAEKKFGRENLVYRKVRGCRRRFSDDVPWRVADGSKRYTVSYRWPMSWYAWILHSKVLAITVLKEPEPINEFLEKESKGGRPRWAWITGGLAPPRNRSEQPVRGMA
jgi:hypothetical protein